MLSIWSLCLYSLDKLILVNNCTVQQRFYLINTAKETTMMVNSESCSPKCYNESN